MLRLVPWRQETATAQVVSVRADATVDAAAVAAVQRTADHDGWQLVLTTALTPAEAAPFLTAGFRRHAELVLLRHPVTPGTVPPGPPVNAAPGEPSADEPGAVIPLRRSRRRDWDAVVDLDARAFPPFWHFDRHGLELALRATPTSRLRIAGEEPVGYAVTGRAGAVAYLQRLAVDPALQGRGLGRSLVVDALRWARRRGAEQVLVNTQRDNGAALALYAACGFRVDPEPLLVLGWSPGTGSAPAADRGVGP